MNFRNHINVTSYWRTIDVHVSCSIDDNVTTRAVTLIKSAKTTVSQLYETEALILNSHPRTEPIVFAAGTANNRRSAIVVDSVGGRKQAHCSGGGGRGDCDLSALLEQLLITMSTWEDAWPLLSLPNKSA